MESINVLNKSLKGDENPKHHLSSSSPPNPQTKLGDTNERV